LNDHQRERALRELGDRLTGSVLTVTASENRSQRRNRAAARERLAHVLRSALTPPTPRRATKPTRASKLRRLADKKRRAEVKARRRRPDPDEADKALLVETYRRHKGRYGQRRIAAALGWNRKKVARLMKQLELKALIRAKKAYRHPAMGEISEHLLKRRFKARKPNEKWLTDVTELKGKDGKLYLSPILDLFNREIVAYAMSRRADSEMVKEMLEKAAPPV